MVTIAILYALYLLVWPYIKGFGLRIFSSEEENERYEAQYQDRKNALKDFIRDRSKALEAYDYLIIESLNAHVVEPDTNKKAFWFHTLFPWNIWGTPSDERDFTEVSNSFLVSGLQLERERIVKDLKWWTFKRNRSSGLKYEAAKRVCSRLRKGMLDIIGLKNGLN